LIYDNPINKTQTCSMSMTFQTFVIVYVSRVCSTVCTWKSVSQTSTTFSAQISHLRRKVSEQRQQSTQNITEMVTWWGHGELINVNLF